jgi:hypothetical protein
MPDEYSNKPYVKYTSLDPHWHQDAMQRSADDEQSCVPTSVTIVMAWESRACVHKPTHLASAGSI